MTSLPTGESITPTRDPAPAPSFLGLATRRMAWKLTWRGWLLLLGVLLALAVSIQLHIYSFLAPNQPWPAPLLIVEGWSPTFTTKQIADEFRSGHFQRVLVLRPITSATNKYESGRFLGDYMVNLLVQDGVPENCVSAIYPPVAKRDRTYSAALAARQWMEEQGISAAIIDVATLGPHARRSRLLFQEAFGDRTKVGVISLDDDGYDSAHWWRTSEGVREVLSEAISYLYARILFHPSETAAESLLRNG